MADLDIRSLPVASDTHAPGQRFYAQVGKRMLDLVLAVLLLPILAPTIAILCWLTRGDGHAGLFSHTRIGRDGMPFTCWKIRTMVPNAEARLAHLLVTNADAAAEWARTQKLRHDPRVTRLGRFLRRTSLDELPQIWNVLRGDMSLVGPRPITAQELSRYGLHSHIYLSMRPGVTGHWQVHGRANGCYEERLRMDQTYAMRMGFWQDLRLIARTALVVVRPTGR